MIFCLCRKCAEIENQNNCTHNKEERSLTRTWIIDEVRKAVEMGYTILTMYKFFEYQVTQYDKESGEGGHFVDYINTFLKIKAEASGYPNWVKIEEQKNEFIESFLNSENILLDRNLIEKNSAKTWFSQTSIKQLLGKIN